MLHRLVLASLLFVACGGDDGTINPDAGTTDVGTDVGSDVGVDAGRDGGTDATGLEANGAVCTAPTDCRSGFCVDGVCCAVACDGVCERCDESGDGSCDAVAADADPDGECGAVSCTTWYVATDDICSFAEDAADSACDGAGACQDTAAVCADQPAGAEQISCAGCASLAADTCVGETPGECVLATSFVDTFDGPALDAGWTVDYVGAAPTFTVGGTLQITDSPPAITPSSTCNWIYDLATDKGNQIGRPVAVGTGDFVLEVDLRGSSSDPQVTLGGVALTNSDDAIEYFAAFWDGSDTGEAVVQGGVSLPGSWSTGSAEGIIASVRVERIGTTITTEVDGVLVDTLTSAADIQNLVIIHTKHVCGPTFEYGTVEIDRISLCY